MNNSEFLTNPENTAENNLENLVETDAENKLIPEEKETAPKNKKSNLKYYLRTSLTLLVISAVTAALLALVNAVTKDRIASNELAVMEQAIVGIFENCTDIEPIDCELKDPVTAVYGVYADGTLLGYGIQSAPVGFKDKIGLIVGADIDGNCLGAEITSISETPGVGTKVKEPSFLAGFRGYNSISIKDCDTIARATVSSKAVKNGIEAALSLDLFANNGAEEAAE